MQHETATRHRRLCGAGERIRTADLLLGKQTFYQLNYTRRHHGVYRLRTVVPSIIAFVTMLVGSVAPVLAQTVAPTTLKTISFSQTTLTKGFTYTDPSGQFRLMIAGGTFTAPTKVTIDRLDPATLPALDPFTRVTDAYRVTALNADGTAAVLAKPFSFQMTVPRPGFTYAIGKLSTDATSWEQLGSYLKDHGTDAIAGDDQPSFTVALFQSQTVQEGVATYYGTYTKKTKLTMVAASNSYPYGTSLKVTNLDNNKTVIVKVVDTGGFKYPTVIDLSTPSFARIQPTWKGVARVRVEIAKPGDVSSPAPADPTPAPTAAAPSFDGADIPTTAATASIAIDVATGQRLIGKTYTKSFPIASLTKLMTAAVFMDTKPDLNKVVTYNAARSGATCACLHLANGEQLTLKDLLFGSLVGSANNATLALADATGMTRAAFVQKMNAKAAALGLTATSYTEPSGLDSGNVSSAADLAKMITVIPDTYPTLKKVLSSGGYSFTSKNNVCLAAYRKNGKCVHTFSTTDKLYGKTSFSIIAAKTGYIDEALNTFVIRGKNADGHEVAVVLLKEYNKNTMFSDANMLMKWVYAHYTWKT